MTTSCPQRWACHRGHGQEPGRGAEANHSGVGGACGRSEDQAEKTIGSADGEAAAGLQRHHDHGETTGQSESSSSVPLSLCLTLHLSVSQVLEHCTVLSSSQMTCLTPTVSPENKVRGVWFQLDNVRVHFETIKVPVCLPLTRLSACQSVCL